MRKSLYDWMYRNNRAPWDIGPRKELVEAVESGRIQPCKAIDLGCGTASNAIFLAQHGFEVTGTDYSPAAIALCRQRGAAAGVAVEWIEDNLNHLQHVCGPFDFLVDWGVYDDRALFGFGPHFTIEKLVERRLTGRYRGRGGVSDDEETRKTVNNTSKITRIDPNDPKSIAAAEAEKKLFAHYGLDYKVHTVRTERPALACARAGGRLRRADADGSGR